HHAKPYRKDDQFLGVAKVFEHLKKNLSNDELLNLIESTPKIIGRIIKITQNYESNSVGSLNKIAWQLNDFDNLMDSFSYLYKSSNFPEFKEYELTDNFNGLQSKISSNAQNNLLRSCVISADRIISSLSAEDLMGYVGEKRLDELLENQQELISNLSNQIVESLSLFPGSERTSKQT